MTQDGAPRVFPWRHYLRLLLLILLLALAPLISVVLTYLIAEANGCRVDEASVHPCIVLGADLGGLLYGMGVMGWLMLTSLPLGALALVVWGVAVAVHLVLHRRAR